MVVGFVFLIEKVVENFILTEEAAGRERKERAWQRQRLELKLEQLANVQVQNDTSHTEDDAVKVSIVIIGDNPLVTDLVLLNDSGADESTFDANGLI